MIRTLRNLLVTAALTVATVGGLAVVAAPAEAATSTYFCFKYGDTNSAYNQQPVHLYRLSGSAWSLVKSGRTAANGCATFTGLAAAGNYTVQATVSLGDANIGIRHYNGWSPMYTPTGTGVANIGTGVVKYVACTPGLNGRCW